MAAQSWTLILSVVLLVVTGCSGVALGQTEPEDEQLMPSPENSIQVVGFAGKSIRLPCGLRRQTAAGSVLEWVDLVYNDDEQPKRIYTTENSVGIDRDHVNHANFRVDVADNVSLTISGLRLDIGAGQYVCRQRLGDRILASHSYYLTIGDMPDCKGDVKLRPDETTMLSCEAQYSGMMSPVMTWVRDGLAVDSKDKYDIMLARRELTVPRVSYQDDGVQYTCDVKFGNVVEQCHRRLDISYIVRDLVLTLQATPVRVGGELHCSARGNPPADITLAVVSTGPTPAAKHEPVRHGKGWSSLNIPRDWYGKEITVQCTATNTFDGQTETLNQTLTFNVTETELVSTREAAASSEVSTAAIAAGVIITVIISIAAVAAILLIRRSRKDDKKPPKGAKPVPTKEEVTLDQNGGQNGQAV